MSPRQILAILRARIWLVFCVLFVTTALVTAASLLIPKRYVAAVSLVIDSKIADPLTGAILPLQMLPGYLSTQVDIMQSHSVALKVVDRLRLTELPAVIEQYQEATKGAGSIRDWLADQLLEQVEVRPSRESSVVDIAYTSSDPLVAAQIANAFADAYIQTSLELKVDPARRQTGWFEDQVTELRKALEQAQQRLSDYQTENDIVVSATDRIDLENARLAELSSQLVAAQSAMYAAETRQNQMDEAVRRGNIDELPDILGNPLVQNLKAEVVRAEGRLADISSRYGTNHPQYVSAVAERNSLREKLLAELSTVRGAIAQNADIARRQVETLQEAVEQQKARVLELNQQRDTLAVLSRDVEIARAAYDAAMQRRAQVRLESEVNHTEISVLNPAVPPIQPSFPLVTLNIALAVVLGTLLGAGIALLAEVMDRRVRLRTDLADLAGVQLLAVLPRPRRRKRGWRKKRAKAAAAAAEAAATLAASPA
jgi:succinoglycan biosynthesis transport protein ExoP